MNAVWSLVPLLVGWAVDPVPDAEDVGPGWIAFVTVVLLGAASLLLWFSMRKQIRRIQVPREDATGRGTAGSETTASENEPEHHDS